MQLNFSFKWHIWNYIKIECLIIWHVYHIGSGQISMYSKWNRSTSSWYGFPIPQTSGIISVFQHKLQMYLIQLLFNFFFFFTTTSIVESHVNDAYLNPLHKHLWFMLYAAYRCQIKLLPRFYSVQVFRLNTDFLI